VPFSRPPRSVEHGTSVCRGESRGTKGEADGWDVLGSLEPPEGNEDHVMLDLPPPSMYRAVREALWLSRAWCTLTSTQ
jgi:hypothetical protein